MHSNGWHEIDGALGAFGLRLIGGFHPRTGDKVPLLPDGRRPNSLLLAGNAGHEMWGKFADADHSGAAPLNDWCREHIDGLLAGLAGAAAAYVSDGPPYWPFQAWARRCGAAFSSPLGILVHPRFGLWHAYRAAIVLPERLDPPQAAPTESPCESCPDKPCLGACPVGAFTTRGYDVPACIGHITASLGNACRERGCQARHACPVGADYAYAPEQASFHMASFIRGNS